MKIIASDFDGTLNYGGIDETKINAINLWRESGNLFVIVTGRGAADFLNMYNENPFPCDYILANNGAIIMNKDGEIICDKRVDGNIAIPFIELLFKNGCPWACVHIDLDYFYVYDDEIKAKENDGYTLENIPQIPFFTQINTALNDFDEAKAVTEIIRENFGAYLNPLQNGRCIDIVSSDMDKAKGIYMLLDAARAQYGDVIAVGDNINDEHMIKEFRSYAMANGVDYIKSIADYITESVTDLIYKEV